MHVATNLVHDLKQALEEFPVASAHCKHDSSIPFRGGGEYKQFVSNHVQKIQDKDYIQWSHMGSTKFQLNLQKIEDRIYECRGCIKGDYPIY